jgi:hypothetical protein
MKQRSQPCTVTSSHALLPAVTRSCCQLAHGGQVATAAGQHERVPQRLRYTLPDSASFCTNLWNAWALCLPAAWPEYDLAHLCGVGWISQKGVVAVSGRCYDAGVAGVVELLCPEPVLPTSIKTPGVKKCAGRELCRPYRQTACLRRPWRVICTLGGDLAE